MIPSAKTGLLLVKGLATYVPGLHARFAKAPCPGTMSAEYCYKVWLDHMRRAHESGFSTAGKSVAELGPGNSIGTGIAALLSGSTSYVGLDLVRYADSAASLDVLGGLVELFAQRRGFPGEVEFPRESISDELLADSLAPERIDRIREDVARLQERDGAMVAYCAPCYDASDLKAASVDVAFSHAVMEHVADPARAYEMLARWMRPGGLMQHVIDFRCHGMAGGWNGHWACPKWLWTVIAGRRPYAINRLPLHAHAEMMQSAGFKVIRVDRQTQASHISRGDLAREFADMPDDDLATYGAFVQAVRE